MRRLLFLFLLTIFGRSQATDTPAPPQPPLRVLLLFPSDLLMPWALTNADITKSAIRAAVPREIDFFAEGLDALRLPGPDYEQEFVALLLKRYRTLPPDLVVFHGPMAGFAERHRADLWPGTPQMAVNAIAGMPSSAYPADLPGTSVSFDLAGTIELARRLQPQARRLVVVGGGPQFSREELDLAHRQIEPFRAHLQVEFLGSTTLTELEPQLAALPRETIVLQLTILRPAKGALLMPREIAQRLAQASNAPSYVYYDSMLGRDFLGGSMANWSAQGALVGKIARELLLHEPRVESLRMHSPAPSVCYLDWRQLQRWKLPRDRVPKECQVLFQPVPFWQQYRREATAIAIALALQSALIVALFLQRRRRQVAELELHNQRTLLTHAARLATVGELSASIAHEVNQPLAAILSNAEAGEQLISSGKAHLDELREIFVSIRDDDVRASKVVQRMRRLLRQEPNEAKPLDVNEAVESILRLTHGLVTRHGVEIHSELDRGLPLINGDFVQIQQVLLNLVVNAVEAMANMPGGLRRVTITTAERPKGNVEIRVTDSGPGIPAEKLPRVFDPFYSTKSEGMGLGLSITRSIVRAHHGQIDAESTGAGAVFRLSLPAICE